MWLLYFVRFRNYCRNKVEKLLHHNNFVYFAEKKSIMLKIEHLMSTFLALFISFSFGRGGRRVNEYLF